MFDYNSSDIDWCEGNYHYFPAIVEFWNTLSSFSFVIFGIYGITNTLFSKIKTAYFLLCVIGFTSAYFHSTLSLFGQLLDEVSILIFIEYIVSILTNSQQKIIVYVISTVPLFVFPQYNAYVMLFVGGGIAVYAWKFKLEKSSNLDLAAFMLLVAWSFWMCDKLCSSIDVDIANTRNPDFKETYFLHTHFIWHICVSAAGYHVVKHLENLYC